MAKKDKAIAQEVAVGDAEAERRTRRRTALERMLEARSVAVVGASVKEGSLGQQMMVELHRGGYEGAIYPGEPRATRRSSVTACYPSIADVPEPVDLAILGVANQRIEQALARRRRGGRALGRHVLVAVRGRAAASRACRRSPSASRRSRATPASPLCGGNGMGFLNLERRSARDRVRHARRHPARAGHVHQSHSGSAFAALAFNDRGIGFNLLVSSGQEIVTTMADYLEYALEPARRRA